MAKDYKVGPTQLIQMFKWSIRTYFETHEDAVLTGNAVTDAAWRAWNELHDEGEIDYIDDDDK